MPIPTAISVWSDGTAHGWTRTTLDRLGKSESFLEGIVAGQPHLLGLESLRTGIHGPFHAVRQLPLKTPTSRGIYPDIVFFTASGHVIVVEVKLCTNPELRDRQVIAQVLDYASSLQALSEDELADLFQDGAPAHWPDVVSRWFPKVTDPEELSATLLQRIQAGEVNIVIACDRAPPGLPAVIRGVTSQSAMGFDLDLAEITPYISQQSPEDIIFIPTTRLTTEIVARTAVTVTYRRSDERPAATVQTLSLEQIEENLNATRSARNVDKRVWDINEIESELQRNSVPFALQVLEFCKRNSADGRLITGAPTVSAGFGFYLDCTRVNGSRGQLMLFSCSAGNSAIYLYFNRIAAMLSSTDYQAFVRRMCELFGNAIRSHQPPKEQYLAFELLSPKWDEFTSLMLWTKEQAIKPKHEEA